MRYFVNTNAAKPVQVGGQTLQFELVANRGGLWLGVLAVDEPAASILASEHPAGIDEIQFDWYERQKKKFSPQQASSTPSAKPTSPNLSVAVADRVGSVIDRAVSKPPVADPVGGIVAVNFQTTDRMPPVEAVLLTKKITKAVVIERQLK